MDEVVVHKPEVGESLRHYLQRYTPDQRQRIYQNKTKLEEFSATLVKTRWREVKEESIEKSLEKLWKILEGLNNFRRLLHFVKMLEPVRRNLLDSLNNYGDVIGKISKWCAGGRILSSAVDNAGTLGGLYLVDTKSSSDNWALGVATIFGFLGVMCSVSEAKMSSDAFKDVMESLNTDQKFMAPIQKWYQQSPELEEEILNIFPFDFTNTILNEFIATGEDKQLNPAKLLSNLLMAMKDLKIMNANGSLKTEEEEFDGNAVQRSSDKDEEGSDMHQDGKGDEEWIKVIKKLLIFVTSKQARELCLSLFVRHHTIIIEATMKAFEQKNMGSYMFYAVQSAAALAPRNRNAYSIPLLGRIGFNLYSMYEGVRSIGRPTPHDILTRQLKKQLEEELVALKKIAVFIQTRSHGLLL